MTRRQILITSALPYANGDIHIGHLVEHIQADIWSRFQKLRGHNCLYICGDDAHGTPIMLKAEEKRITPDELVSQMYERHVQDFAAFHIDFDNYHTTHSKLNRELVESIYQALCDNDDIAVRTIEQAFDPERQMFLPDRFVKGSCPKCHAQDQHGDNCEVCGAHYDPTELIDPVSALSGATPIRKSSQHFFFKLDKYRDFLHDWIHHDTLQPEVVNKLEEWFDQGLQQWDISRDAPYFGFAVPGEPDKYFYVWLDAPVGYMASLMDLANKRQDIDFNAYWAADSQAELYHFIGKDIIYFHALFWPAMLEGSGYRKPSGVYSHGFLTINGQKMSKSRGTFINARQFVEYVNPDCFRYYMATKLTDSVEDLDFNFEDFVTRINSDLIGKYINIASRSAGFISKRFDGLLSDELEDPELYNHFLRTGESIAELMEKRQYHKAVASIMELADRANQYVNDKEPWKLAKDSNQQELTQKVCTQAINLFMVLTVYLKPIIPELAEKAEAFLNTEVTLWGESIEPILGHQINKFKPLLNRLQLDTVQAMMT